MGSEEHKEENRAIYNLILFTVTVLGVACGVWMHHDSPTPPSVRLNDLSASYILKSSNSHKYPLHRKYDNTTFYVNVTVRNDERRWAATLEYVDVWVNARAKTFMRIKLGQKMVMDAFMLKPGEEKVVEVKVIQDRPVRETEWEQMLLSVFVKAHFPESKDILGRPRTAYKTRDCSNLKATLHNASSTAVVEGSQLPKWCDDPY